MRYLDKLSGADILAMQHVKRWHMVRTKRSQTLAEHSASVASLALKVACAWDQRAVDQNGYASVILDRGLCHDAHEVEYGDMPSPTLRSLPGLGERVQRLFWLRRGAEWGSAGAFVDKCVDLADKLEAFQFYTLEGEDPRFGGWMRAGLLERLEGAPKSVVNLVMDLAEATVRGDFTPQPPKDGKAYEAGDPEFDAMYVRGTVAEFDYGPAPDPWDGAVKVSEFQYLIGAWADSVFPGRRVHETVSKLVLEELPEFLKGMDSPGEYADLLVLILDVAYQKGINAEVALREKMKVNAGRTWKQDPVTGLYHHVGQDPAGK